MTKPAFTGAFEFKLTVTIFGESVDRDAKITYVYTPAWPYFDAISRMEQVGEFVSGLGLLVLGNARPQIFKTKPKNRPPNWVRCDALLSAGVLHRSVYDQLLARIERDAVNTDRKNRVFAGIPVPPLPEQA